MLCPDVEGLTAVASNSGSVGNGPEEEAAVPWAAWGWPSLALEPKGCWLDTSGGLGNELFRFCCLQTAAWPAGFEGSARRFRREPCLDWDGPAAEEPEAVLCGCSADNFSARRAKAFCRFSSIFFLCSSVSGKDIFNRIGSCRDVAL